jgi:formate hydrogenlyase subunit 4
MTVDVLGGLLGPPAVAALLCVPRWWRHNLSWFLMWWLLAGVWVVGWCWLSTDWAGLAAAVLSLAGAGTVKVCSAQGRPR